jgi:Tfp pilus assembly protein PilV
MKQIIVMIAMVLLGITIAGFVGEFSDSAESIADSANEQIKTIAGDE